MGLSFIGLWLIKFIHDAQRKNGLKYCGINQGAIFPVTICPLFSKHYKKPETEDVQRLIYTQTTPHMGGV